MPWGRGGAGNIEYANQAAAAAIVESQELAQGKDESSPIETALINEQQKKQAALIEHQHEAQVRQRAEAKKEAEIGVGYGLSGRGGAGNWYDRGELERDGKWTNGEDGAAHSKPIDVPARGASKMQDGSIASAFRGRGGAGNFAGEGGDAQAIDTGAAEAQEQDTRRLADEEMGIDMPQEPEPAYLGGRVRDFSGRVHPYQLQSNSTSTT